MKKKIMAIITQRPGIVMSTLCKKLGTSRYKVQRVVDEMVGAGEIEKLPKGSHDGLRAGRGETK